MVLPKLIITDIDGVWTDGGMYYGQDNIELKKFNTSDSAGVLFCKLLGIEIAIITGEDTPIVQRRAEKLKINVCHLGVKNKVECVGKIIRGKYSWDEIAYIGDDINDIELLKRVGISGVPHSAPDYVKKYANVKLFKSGGEGVFREFVELILREHNLLEKVLTMYLESQAGFAQ